MKREQFVTSALFVLVLFLSIWTMLLMVWTPGATAAPEKVQLRMGGSNVGTSVYMFSAVMVDIWKRNIPDLDITLLATAGSVANYLPLSKGELDLATGAVEEDWRSLEGMNFSKTKITNFCILFPVSVVFHQLITYIDSPIKSWKDLDGKAVCIGARASPSSVSYSRFFDILEIKPKLIFSTPTEAADMMKDRRADAMGYGTGVPFSLFIDISKSVPIKLVPMKLEDQKKIVQASPWVTPATLPAKTYSFQNEDCPTVIIHSDIIVNPALSEELVYKLTKVAWENWGEIEKVYPAVKGVSPKDILSSVAPIHPGGVRYYREIGIKIPDRLIWKK
jgi:hypothetical protein